MIDSIHPKTNLSVSIVLYNSPLELVCSTVDSLRSSAQHARDAGSLGQVTVWLIDNASGTAYRDALQAQLDRWAGGEWFDVQYSPQSTNFGFGHGHNTVIPGLATDFHLVLNPDVELQRDTLHVGLTALCQSSDIALLSPGVIGSHGEQEFLCKRYPTALVLLLRGFAPGFVRRLFQRRLASYEMRDLCSGDTAAEVEIASGCFMLMRTAALRAVGGFNEDFFLYFEDFDLSLRLATQGRLVFDPTMRIVHHGGYAASKGHRHRQYFIRSGVRFFNRHGWRFL
ncbi:N-acetylglucosaminyl-diphospho-decaprenol L-rhamnosyltransferase [Halioglobus japonicus]|nr:N-acetylglucosaminyl-diphospho-decaprenol L-rhamnosyltransferase [Halioglobus japonicus]